MSVNNSFTKNIYNMVMWIELKILSFTLKNLDTGHLSILIKSITIEHNTGHTVTCIPKKECMHCLPYKNYSIQNLEYLYLSNLTYLYQLYHIQGELLWSRTRIVVHVEPANDLS